MKRLGFVFVCFFACFFLELRGVYAEDGCYQNYRYTYKNGDYQLTQDFNSPISLKPNEQICSIGSETVNAYPYIHVYDTVLTCQENNGEFKFDVEECYHTGREDVPCVADSVSKTAKCTSEVKKCRIVYNGNNTELSSTGGAACVPNSNDYGTCDNSGNFKIAGNCGDVKTYYCETIMNTNGFLANFGKYDYKCKTFDCSLEDSKTTFTAKNGDFECITVNGFWYQAKCNNGTFDKGESCGGNKCVENKENVLSCVSPNEAQCLQVEGNSVSHSSVRKEEGKVCHGNKVYICTKDDAPNFTLQQDCSVLTDDEGKSKECGIVGGIVGCYSKGEIIQSGENQNFVTIEISTDTGFFCDGGRGIETALGCIPYSMSGLAEKLLPLLFGVAGGISFLLMVYGFILMATSSGDEKKLVEARSRITSAVIGLLVSIFAIFLFRLIFSNILKIPGL